MSGNSNTNDVSPTLKRQSSNTIDDDDRSPSPWGGAKRSFALSVMNLSNLDSVDSKDMMELVGELKKPPASPAEDSGIERNDRSASTSPDAPSIRSVHGNGEHSSADLTPSQPLKSGNQETGTNGRLLAGHLLASTPLRESPPRLPLSSIESTPNKDDGEERALSRSRSQTPTADSDITSKSGSESSSGDTTPTNNHSGESSPIGSPGYPNPPTPGKYGWESPEGLDFLDYYFSPIQPKVQQQQEIREEKCMLPQKNTQTGHWEIDQKHPPKDMRFAKWNECARQLLEKMMADKHLQSFLSTEYTHRGEQLGFETAQEKLAAEGFGTKASFEFVFKEIAERSQNDVMEGSKTWYQAEYLKLYFRCHFDATVNWQYSSDMLENLHSTLEDIKRQLESFEIKEHGQPSDQPSTSSSY